MLDLEKITTEVRKIAVEAGSFLREERRKFRRELVEEKNSHDYVSYVDKESERRVVEKLKALLPEAGFIAEEGSGSLTSEESCWLVDPLDGTTNFIHDNAPYCVSIALRNREELLLGVVYEVCRNECYWARRGGKAYLPSWIRLLLLWNFPMLWINTNRRHFIWSMRYMEMPVECGCRELPPSKCVMWQPGVSKQE